MANAKRTRQADADLSEIWAHIGENNIEAANAMIRSIGQRCRGYADFPGIGRRHEDLAPGLRSVIEGSYVIYYNVVDDGIEVVRALHGSQDLPSQFN